MYWQTFVGPLTAAGVAGAVAFTVKVLVSGAAQTLVTTTEMVPPAYPVGYLKLMLLVPCPVTEVAPAGIVQV